MANERNTENVVRDKMRKLSYYDSDVVVEEQRSAIGQVSRLLRTASKSGTERVGAPEFIVTHPDFPDFVMVVECKADVRHQKSNELDRPVEFALDGAVHYARALARDFNVVAVGVSGEKPSEALWDFMLVAKGTSTAVELKTPKGALVRTLIPFSEIVAAASFDPAVERARVDDLMSFSRDLHEFMREHAKLTESEKPLLVSGTLIALQNVAFAKTYGDYSPNELRSQWFSVIAKEIEKAEIPHSKSVEMSAPYQSLASHPELAKASKKWPRGPLFELIKNLHEKVWPFISVYHDFDVVGQFYGEFLKYTGGDKKSLGIVLTPRHITELFTLLANINVSSKVLDPAAGTGGFLISAMSQMMRLATTEEQRESIKSSQLIGVEQQPNMFALAASNMLLRGDGKANLYQGSCFDPDISDKLSAHRCNVGMVNPPYSQRDESQQELAFVQLMLDALVEGGTGLAIVPLKCATTPHPMRTKLLESHTLEAVMSMPHDLFAPVATVTCVMVFTAHKPHDHSDRKTWLGFWREDGFARTKTLGRADLRSRWPAIRERWVREFRDRDVSSGLSVLAKLGPDDDWTPEAHMTTDYTAISRQTFEHEVRQLAAFRLLHDENDIDRVPPTATPEIGDPHSWPAWRIDELFEVVRSKELVRRDLEPGTTPYVGASERDNGVAGWVAREPDFEANQLTMAYDGSVGATYFQPYPFCVSEKVFVLKADPTISSRALMFVAVMIRAERYRFSYGRKWNGHRLTTTPIRLPGTASGHPDWDLMDRFVASLRVSDIAFAEVGQSQ